MVEPNSGRDNKGRFVKGHTLSQGHKGGPGRPPKAREERYNQIIMSACSFAKWRLICDRAVVQAIEGDAHARKWVTDHLIGTTPLKLEHSGITLVYSGNVDPNEI